MALFWIFAGAIALAVAVILMRAFWAGQRDMGASAGYDLQVYRGQLADLEKDKARGVVTEDEAERLRVEISRRILAADTAASEVQAAQEERRGSKLWGYGIGAVILAGAFGVYTQIGAPGYPDLPLEKRIANAAELRAERTSQSDAEAALPPSPPAQVAPEYLELVTQLRDTVAERPGDVEGLALLVREEANLGNYKEAYQAQGKRLTALAEQASADDYAQLGGLMVVAAGGYVSPEAQDAFAAALSRDRSHSMARYYAGMMMAQTGRPDVAFRMWDQVLRDGPEEAPWMPVIRERLPQLARLAGAKNYSLPTPPSAAPALSGPSREDMEAAQDMSPEDRQEMIRGMVDGLSARLAEEGGSAPEWARLITALGVLGETDRASAIWNEAQSIFAIAPNDLEVIRQAAQQIGLTE